jgi:hypothetical protein
MSHRSTTLLAALLMWVGVVRAQPVLEAARTLQVFDFEERERGNVEDLPMDWLKVEGNGLPHYVNGFLDTAIGASGRSSFRFDLNGGSLIYRYPAGKIPVLPGAVYRVDVKSRTTALQLARARLTAYFADVDGKPILQSIRRSTPLVSASGDASWHTLSVQIPADFDDAASLVIELGLLQPARLSVDSVPPPIPVEDIHGSAWFDDVRVAQVPRVTIRTSRPGNIFPKSAPARFSIGVKDRITTDLSAKLSITDSSNKSVYQRTGKLSLRAGETTELFGLVEIPDLAPGWYRATLDLDSAGAPVGSHTIGFIQLGDEGNDLRPDPRFGLIATHLDPDTWPLLPGIIRDVGFGRVKLAVWSRDSGTDSTPSAELDDLLTRFSAQNIDVTACLADIPPAVRSATGAGDWQSLLKGKPNGWRDPLIFLLSRHGNHLRNWQLFTDDMAQDVARSPELQEVYKQFLAEYQKLQGDSNLALPWPTMVESTSLTGAMALTVPPEVLPQQLPIYVSEFRGTTGRRVSLTLVPLDADRYGRVEQIRDLALRFAYALSAGVEQIDLQLPIEFRKEEGAIVADPQELLLTLRSLRNQLSQSVFKGRVPLGDGVDAFLFERDGVGTLMVFSKLRASDSDVARVSVALGDRATRVDLLGATSELPVGKGRPREVTIDVGPMPVFVTNVDSELMQMRASLSIDNPLLESSVDKHQRNLRIKNTLNTPVSGTVRVRGPDRWTILVDNINFALGPGETANVPLSIEFPLNSFAGDKTLQVHLHIAGTRQYDITVPVTVKLGLKDLGLTSLALRDGDSLLILQQITNYGAEPVNYTSFVSMTGFARQEQLVNNLAPGRSTIKRYRFPITEGQTLPPRLRSGVREQQGVKVLNEEVQVR